MRRMVVVVVAIVVVFVVKVAVGQIAAAEEHVGARGLIGVLEADLCLECLAGAIEVCTLAAGPARPHPLAASATSLVVVVV